LKAVLEEVTPEFTRATGHTLVVTYGTSASLKQQIDGGRPFDVAVLTPALLDDLVARGTIDGGTRAEIARAGMAILIRAGRPAPDISTVDALKRTLLDARSIAYAKDGAAGVYFVALVQRLGIADALTAKSMPTATGEQVSQAVAGGQSDLGVLPLSEILPVRGVQPVGSFPAEVQGYAVMAGGVSRAARDSRAAQALMTFLTDPAIVPVIVKKGMQK
jgi:molybdate transport system substrate-binding protein